MTLSGKASTEIEPELHQRNLALGEDAGEVLAALSNGPLYLLSGMGADSPAAATRRLAARPEEAIDFLNPPA